MGVKTVYILLCTHTGEVLQRGELHVLVLIQEHFQLKHADPQISLVELVGIVPANGAEFPSLLHNRVEEAEREQELLEIARLSGFLKKLFVANWILFGNFDDSIMRMVTLFAVHRG